jgi:hypothetical protein
MMSKDELIIAVVSLAGKTRKEKPTLRYGQSLFNALYDLAPELADSIRGNSSIDPFYSDEHVEAFFIWLSQ